MNFEDLEFALWLHDSRYLEVQCAFSEYLNNLNDSECEKNYREVLKTLEDTYYYIADSIRGCEFGKTKKLDNIDEIKTKMNNRIQLEDMINITMKDIEEMRTIINNSTEGPEYEMALSRSQHDIRMLNDYRRQLDAQRDEIIELVRNNIIE